MKIIASILIPVILVGMLVVPFSAVASTTVSIEDVSAAQGETVTVQVNIADVSNMCGAAIGLSYDNQVVTVENVVDGDLGTIIYSIDNDAGITKMNWDTTEGKTGSFVFADITLKAVGNPCDEGKLDLDVKELYDCVYPFIEIPRTVVDGTFKISCFDTGSGTYPSIFGTHNGTITPNQTIKVSTMYTYPCSGTGGHSEYARIWNSTLDVNATWNGYKEDWHNISFNKSFMLVANETYNYTIRTGSYPQIIRESPFNATGGTITCDKFIDANGRIYYDRIPAIKLFL